jgi:hypothetical protein
MESGGSTEGKHGVHGPGGLPKPPVDDDADPGATPEPADLTPWYHMTSFRVAVGIVVVIMVIAWRAGTFDHVLYNVGLNAKECARNGFGAVFCGSELDEYREHIESAKREGKEASEKIVHEASENAAKAQSEIKADEERSEQALKQSQESSRPAEEQPAAVESG